MLASPIEQQMCRAEIAQTNAVSTIMDRLHSIGCPATIVCGSIIIPEDWHTRALEIIDDEYGKALDNTTNLTIHKEMV